MEIDEDSLGLNQRKWFSQQKLLKKIYPWIEINNIPDEVRLEIFKECPVRQSNTSCFVEGFCMDPGSLKCVKERK